MSILGKIKFAAFLIAGKAGVIWFVNLPYPMIRKPVSRIAPRLSQQTLAGKTAKAEIIRIMNQLSSVESGTTSYAEAQRLLKLADDKLKQLWSGRIVVF